MAGMFGKCSSLTSLDVSGFNTSSVRRMEFMFYGCSSLTTLDVSGFNTSKVTWMWGMFENCSSLTSLDVSKFDTSSATNLTNMFSGCSSLISLDLSSFNTKNVSTMYCMFMNCSGLTNLDLSNFDTPELNSISYMFYGCSGLKSVNMSGFSTEKVKSMNGVWKGCGNLKTIYVGSGWDTGAVTDGNEMFKGCGELIGGAGTVFDPSQTGLTRAHIDEGTVNPGYLTRKENPAEAYAVLSDKNDYVTFYYDTKKKSRGGFDINNISNAHKSPYKSVSTAIFDRSFDEYRPISTSYWFYDCSSLTSIVGLEYLHTEKVRDMSWMFCQCKSLTNLDLSSFNTENVTDMSLMFQLCQNLESLNVSSFNTSNVTDMNSMFCYCSHLRELDVNGFNTNNVISMWNMFMNCSSLTRINVRGFNTSLVENMGEMFYGCENLTSIDLSNFDTSNVTIMFTMFYGCSNLTSLDLSSFNTSKVIHMEEMFDWCNKLKTIYVGSGWSTASVVNSDNMFRNCTNLKGGAGTTYDANHVDVAYAHIDGGTSNPGYLTDVNAPQDGVAISAKSYTREYGEENPAFEYDVTEGAVTSGTPEITCVATAKSSVGTYDIVISKGTISNSSVELTNGTLTVTKAPLTISVGEYTRQEGEENPEFELIYDGFKNGETDGVLTKRPTVKCIATKDSEPSEYVITIEGAEAENYDIRYAPGMLTVTAKPLPEITPIEGETTVSTDGLSEADLTDNVVNDVYYNVGEDGYDAAEKSIVISQTTNMAQIADKQPGSKDVKENFNGMILKVAKGKGLITVNVKTSGNAQLIVQVGNGTPMLASKTEKGDVVFSYDVEEDTYVYIYAIIGSSAAKGYGLNAADTDSSVRIYSITVSPGATGIRSIGASEKDDAVIFDLQGRRVDNPAKGIYIVGGRKVSVK